MQRDPAGAVPCPRTSPGEAVDLECPICYQEYNQYNKSPRMSECLHVFCTECSERMQLNPCDPTDPRRGPQVIPCPLCRHLTPLHTGNARALPCNSQIMSRSPRTALRVPATVASRVATVTQRVVLSSEGGGGSRESRLIVSPTVSSQVQQMHPGRSYGAAPDSVGEERIIEQSSRTSVCVQSSAVIFWVSFVITCVVGVVFGPHFFNRQF